MLFNTIEFWVFFAFVLALYPLLRRRGQNLFLLLASYFFYACWDWRFLGLLLLSSTTDWFLGAAIARSRGTAKAKRWVALSVGLNLVFLGTFKYCNFMVEAASALLASLGLDPLRFHLEVVLPVGISFYTFQSISYIVDVYRGEVEAAADPVDFALFVAFFPHMVAGPIMPSNALLPQMQRERRMCWSDLASGFHLAMWGLFKKVVVADNLAVITSPLFAHAKYFRPGPMHLGALAFAFQIYCDFSGYTDIARGVARMMGFTLMDNFKHPYFATSITDFWHRWHISLSSWLRHYLYFPLGGNREGAGRTYRNLFLTMVLGGLWHGARWNFVIWGAYQGGLLVLERRLGGRRLVLDWFEARGLWPRMRWLLQVAVTFHFVCLGWILFRCEDTSTLPRMVAGFMDVRGWLRMPSGLQPVLILITPLLLVDLSDFLSRREQSMLLFPGPLRALLYLLGLYAFLLFGRFESNAFIYFQF